MKIGLAGWGIETQSAYRYFGDEHSYLICNEEPRDDFPEQANVDLNYLEAKRAPGLTGNASDLSYLDGLETCDKIITTPVVVKRLETKFGLDSEIWAKVESTFDIFFDNFDRNRIIGVTGTKGKGTTSSLIAEMLNASGTKTYLAGNIGVPVLDLLPKLTDNDWVVLEMSSFQLYKFKKSPHIAVHLMQVPEHIAEWHLTIEDYVESKRHIFEYQQEGDIAVYNPLNSNSANNVNASKGVHIPYMKAPGAEVKDGCIFIDNRQIITIDNLGLIGEHNQENVCAAVTAAWQVTQNQEAFHQVLRDFKGLEHRLQLVASKNEIDYYDDSFGTTPATTSVAIKSFSKPIILILGGHDKGNDFSDLIQDILESNVKHIVLIGIIAQDLFGLLTQAGFSSTNITIKDNDHQWTMTEILEAANSQAQPGDVVLLSCGTSSFGLFIDYKDRGNQFIKAVQQLS